MPTPFFHLPIELSFEEYARFTRYRLLMTPLPSFLAPNATTTIDLFPIERVRFFAFTN